MIIQYDFNACNTPKTLIHIKVEDGITKVFVPGARDIIIVPEGTGLDVSVEYRAFTSDAVGRVEVMRNPPGGVVTL